MGGLLYWCSSWSEMENGESDTEICAQLRRHGINGRDGKDIWGLCRSVGVVVAEIVNYGQASDSYLVSGVIFVGLVI